MSNPKPVKPLKVFVTGPTGTTGRMVVQELLKRGHLVTGFSKNPQKYGADPNYKPVRGSQTDNVAYLGQVFTAIPSLTTIGLTRDIGLGR